jgi:DNA transposition AAA+ family ATPase
MSTTMDEALDQISDEIDIVATRNRFNAIVAEQKLAGRTMPKIAPETGVPYGTLHAWASGKYQGDNTGIALRVAAWMVKIEAEAHVRSKVRANPGFLRTRTASEIFDILEYAQMAPDMATYSGAPGVGKTTALNAYKAAGSQVWLVTAEPAIKTIGALLDMVAEALGADFGHGSATMSRNIRRRLTGTHGLLIVDEVHHLSLVLRDQLRCTVIDAAGIGMALVGNADLDNQLARERATGQHAQLISRIGLRGTRPRPFRSDVELMLDGWGILGIEAREIALGIAMQPGALREMNKTLRSAFSLSDLRGDEEPTAADIRAAHQRRGGNA